MFTPCKFGIFPSKIEILHAIEYSIYMGRNLSRHSTMNNRRYGNIFPLVRSALDREIQGLSFDA